MMNRTPQYPASRALIGLLLVFVLLAGAVSIASPLFESSDEIRHYRYIRILVTEHRLPVQGAEPARAQSHHPPLYYALSAALSAWVPSTHTGTYQHPDNPFWGYRSYVPGVDNKLQYWHGPAEPFREGYLAALVPRWVNVLVGAATVAVTYALAYRALGGGAQQGTNYREDASRAGSALALAAAAIVALNPQFIYLSAAINNDIVAALGGASILLACVITIQDGLNRRNVIAVGATSGFGLLTKLQVGLLGPVVVLALILAARKTNGHRTWLVGAIRALVTAGLVVAAISGWWFARNIRLYGEPTGMRLQAEMWGGRNVADNLWAIGQGWPQLWASLWGQFGYGQIPLPGWMTTTLLAGCLLCLSGHLWTRKAVLSTEVTSGLSAAIVIAVGLAAYYMAANPAGAMGRFLFPVLPAFAILLVAGLDKYLNHPGRTRALTIGTMGLFASIALCGFLWPAVSYPRRGTISTAPEHNETTLHVGDVAEILEVTIDQGEAKPGGEIVIQVNWLPLRWTEEPLTVFVHVVDEAGVVVAQRDTWPGLGRAATTSWRANVPFIDVYRVDLPETLYTPNKLTVRIGLYGNAAGRLPISAGSEAAVDNWTVKQLDVAASEGEWPNRLDISFENQLRLVGYKISPRVLAPGEAFTLTTIWDVSQSPATQPHLFAQVLDTSWNVWGSKDGGHPTWTSGIVTDTRKITLIPETPSGSFPVNVGLVINGDRMHVLGPDGNPIGDFVALGPIGVR